MTQKKLQHKTVTAYMCSQQPGNFGLIHLIKQQSQRIADCYALALVSFICNLRSFFPRDRFSIPVPISLPDNTAKVLFLALCSRISLPVSTSVSQHLST